MEDLLNQARMYSHLHADVKTMYNTEMINNLKIKKFSCIIRYILLLKVVQFDPDDSVDKVLPPTGRTGAHP